MKDVPMGFDIKHMKPNKKGRYQQGAIHPGNCHKLYESQQNKPVIYRSSYELKFIQWCEMSPRVLQWGNECIKIPYMLGKECHSYYPDFVLTMDNGEKWVVEIKPKAQTQKPLSNNTYAQEQWLKNMAKWKAAIAFCDQHGLKFKIFTEDTIERLK